MLFSDIVLNPRVAIYVLMVKRELKKIEDIPEKYREAVIRALAN